jgi:hypothetical protein
VVPLSIDLSPKLSAYHDRTVRPGCNGSLPGGTAAQPEVPPIAGCGITSW